MRYSKRKAGGKVGGSAKTASAGAAKTKAPEKEKEDDHSGEVHTGKFTSSTAGRTSSRRLFSHPTKGDMPLGPGLGDIRDERAQRRQDEELARHEQEEATRREAEAAGLATDAAAAPSQEEATRPATEAAAAAASAAAASASASSNAAEGPSASGEAGEGAARPPGWALLDVLDATSNDSSPARQGDISPNEDPHVDDDLVPGVGDEEDAEGADGGNGQPSDHVELQYWVGAICIKKNGQPFQLTFRDCGRDLSSQIIVEEGFTAEAMVVHCKGLHWKCLHPGTANWNGDWREPIQDPNLARQLQRARQEGYIPADADVHDWHVTLPAVAHSGSLYSGQFVLDDEGHAYQPIDPSCSVNPVTRNAYLKALAARKVNTVKNYGLDDCLSTFGFKNRWRKYCHAHEGETLSHWTAPKLLARSDLIVTDVKAAEFMALEASSKKQKGTEKAGRIGTSHLSGAKKALLDLCKAQKDFCKPSDASIDLAKIAEQAKKVLTLQRRGLAEDRAANYSRRGRSLAGELLTADQYSKMSRWCAAVDKHGAIEGFDKLKWLGADKAYCAIIGSECASPPHRPC